MVLGSNVEDTVHDSPIRNENGFHVFHHPLWLALDETAVVDVVAITGGNANRSFPSEQGGGFYNYESGPQVTNWTIDGNLAKLGSAFCSDLAKLQSPPIGPGGGRFDHLRRPV